MYPGRWKDSGLRVRSTSPRPSASAIRPVASIARNARVSGATRSSRRKAVSTDAGAASTAIVSELVRSRVPTAARGTATAVTPGADAEAPSAMVDSRVLVATAATGARRGGRDRPPAGRQHVPGRAEPGAALPAGVTGLCVALIAVQRMAGIGDLR